MAEVPAGTLIFRSGTAPDNLLLLLEGTVRVQQVAENGREIVLYRVQAGESCILTIACLLANTLTACCRANGLAEPEGLTA